MFFNFIINFSLVSGLVHLLFPPTAPLMFPIITWKKGLHMLSNVKTYISLEQWFSICRTNPLGLYDPFIGGGTDHPGRSTRPVPVRHPGKRYGIRRLCGRADDPFSQ